VKSVEVKSWRVICQTMMNVNEYDEVAEKRYANANELEQI